MFVSWNVPSEEKFKPTYQVRYKYGAVDNIVEVPLHYIKIIVPSRETYISVWVRAKCVCGTLGLWKQVTTDKRKQQCSEQ